MTRDQKDVALLAGVGLVLTLYARSPRPETPIHTRAREAAAVRASGPVAAPVISDTRIVERVVQGNLEFFYNAKGVLVAARDQGRPLRYEFEPVSVTGLPELNK